ncbi:allatotropins isoform X2 [Folsomia candida]|uniref:allatotropins isoform X2 n=1 Tax=Folsomia candida TaxID=158441 RepID=UPI000B8FDA4F|nr:allatotropins isoform X2 [Folsomia candida]
MSKTVQYVLVCWLLTLAVVACSTATRTGYPRSNRGFKSQGLSTARGFGKRDPGLSLGQGVFAGLQQPGQQQQANVEGLLSPNFDLTRAYPNSWLIEELQNNPEAAKLIVDKVIDENGDGELTPDELFRRIYF